MIIYEAPKWMKLDNAATIYPSTITRKYSSMFRLTITLKDKVDPVILKKALGNVINRIPSFGYRLRKGLFWYYLSRIDDIPDVQEDVLNPMFRIKWKENKHFMFRIRYHESRIAIEIFHALTDGMGGITFLLTLTGEYLRLKYKCKVKYNELILNPKDTPKEEEYEDSFKKVARFVGGLEKEKSAYHIIGKLEESHMLNIITGTIPIDKIKPLSKQYNSTITEFLAALMIDSIQEIQEKDKTKNNRKKPIKISIPVNLRKLYSSITLRNFSSYVNVGIESKYGHYSFEEIIVQVKSQMGIMATEKRLNAKLTGNVKAENNKFIRLTPIFIKKYVLSISEKLMGDRYCSSTLSNLGNIEIPEPMNQYISKMNIIIGRSRGKSGSASCISFNNNLYITFSRRIFESEFERLFFTKLVEMGIPVEIESNQRR